MTTKVIIENEPTSNGDVQLRAVNTSEGTFDRTLYPGDRHEFWITTTSALFVTETWPTVKPKEQPQEDHPA